MVVGVSFFTDEVSSDLAESMRLGREAGADSIELRSLVFGKRIDQCSPAELKAIKAMTREASLFVSCIASSFGKCVLDNDNEWQEHQDILHGSIAAAHALSTDIVRVFPFWTPDNQEWPRPNLEAFLPRIVNRLRWAVSLAEQEDIKLSFETEPSTFSGNCEEVQRIVEALGTSPALAIAWDVNNAWVASREEPLISYQRIRGRVSHLHVKPNAQGNIDTVGDSQTSYADVLRALVNDGYSGAASIEHWGTPEMMLSGIKQLRVLIDAL